MIVLLDFCSIHWLIPWLLPFLLGLLLGWLIWGRYKQMVNDLKDEIKDLQSRISDLEADLATCRSARSNLESEVALLKGRIREIGSGEVDSASSAITIDVGGGSGEGRSTSPDIVGVTGSGIKVFGIADDKFAQIPKDNLQIIEGIGPKMESLLKDNGMANWAVLAGKSKADMDAMLAKYGDKYRIIDPSNWPIQAQMADRGDWDELISFQHSLGAGGRKSSSRNTVSKVEKILVRLKIIKRWKQDDLKAIEGVGPKIENLLHKAGINSWSALASTQVSRLQKILEDAGERYRLAKPATWPEQANLASKGDWDALEKLQGRLTGGRR